MCIERIKKYSTVVKRDRQVYRVFRRSNSIGGYFLTSVWAHAREREGDGWIWIKFNPGLNEDPRRHYRIFTGSKSHNAGFHCFPDRESANDFFERMLVQALQCTVLPVTIPAGTTIVTGTQDGLSVIVTPVFYLEPAVYKEALE